MISHTNKHFREFFSKLPNVVQRQAREAYRQFKQNPYHPSLHFKKVHTIRPIYSARINVDYRAVGIKENGEIVWFWIGSHADYGKLLSQL